MNLIQEITVDWKNQKDIIKGRPQLRGLSYIIV